MLITRIYALSWILVAGAVGVLYLTGSLTYGTVMFSGFITSVLAGAGLLVVYPVLMTEKVRKGAKL